MKIPKLEPDIEYEGESGNYYHGFGCTSRLEGILDAGALLSPGRREDHPDDVIREKFYEDILRHAGTDVLRHNFGDMSKLQEYVDENREELRSMGSDYTNWVLEGEEELPFSQPPDFRGQSLVWVSQDQKESRNYSLGSDNEMSDPQGGFFKLSLPEDYVMHLGLNGGVPGEIPLEYADELYLENVSEKESREIWMDFVSERYDVNVHRI